MRMKILAVIIITVFLQIQLFSQKSSLQIGFGMHQDMYSGYSHVVDSFLIRPIYPDELRPMGTILYQRKFTDKIEIGLSYSKTYYSYAVGLFKPELNDYVEKIGFRIVNVFNVPVNVNFTLMRNLYLKGGVSVNLGILNSYKPMSFDKIPEIDDIYNSMQTIIKPHSLNYGFGIGYKIRRFDIVFYRKHSFGRFANPIKVNDKYYRVFDKFFSNSLSLFYSMKVK